jgi:hypothetical protein
VTGALNIYATEPETFDSDAVILGQMSAGYAAVAIANAHLYGAQANLAQQMQMAMQSRAVIEQAQIAPTLVPYLTCRAINLHRYPDGAEAKGFWHKELPAHAPDWLPRWDNPAADPGETRTYLVVDEPAALVWAANFGSLEMAPVDLPGRGVARAHLRAHRPRPRHLHSLAGRPDTRPPAPHRVRTPERRRPSQGHRLARHPDLVADQHRVRLRRHPGLGGTPFPYGRSRASRPGQLEVAAQRPRRPGPAGLHPERDQQDTGRPVQSPPGRRGPGLRADRLGRAG